MDFDEAADELYGVLPSEFTATRKRLAGELPRDDARRLTAMRRPTVPAWAVNLLVRDDAVGPVLELGERMRAAWSEGGDLTALDRERASLVEDLVRRARTLADEAGRPLSDAFADEVDETLRAAIADPSAADAVRAGRLDHPLRHTGFGPFGAAAPPARPKPPPRPAKKTREDEDAARAERERKDRERRAERARDAERKAEEAERSLAEWTSTLEEARGRLADAERELDDLRERVRDAEARRTGLARRAQVAEREHDRAERTAEEARRRARELAADPS
ncbi:hypothetical protein [Actinoallomurus iriomotensis]|uniref:Uncharacterized protein n=1 Tax=Actinoallomurus iriomotensis TaxID=478107 RepID=A0A9W6RF01_9ACTN|nr:hypothetical protein [Actinoallomurus iriomotensis]GLY72685.1 hypothetical protein Airi01_009520 [Actinoallomurus iriomotensis]